VKLYNEEVGEKRLLGSENSHLGGNNINLPQSSIQVIFATFKAKLIGKSLGGEAKTKLISVFCDVHLCLFKRCISVVLSFPY
jgi:hypothetical protein